MELTQISTLLNSTIVPNILGQGESSGTPITIAEDLRNVVDIGTAIASMDADMIKDYMKQLAVGVYDTYVDTRRYKDDTYGLIAESYEFGGILQRLKCKLTSASDSHILDPVPAASSGPDYTDAKFYGQTWTDNIYHIDTVFKIKYSISTEAFKKAFTSIEGVQKLIAMIEANIDTTLRVELNGLARGVLRTLILSANNGNRVIPLLTTFNNEMGYVSTDAGYVTLSNWKTSTPFKLWCQETILNLKKYMTDINEKYNDGTVETFTPENDVRSYLLTEFSTALNVALGGVFHDELVRGTGTYYEINYWQNSSPDLLPAIKSGSLHDQIVETETDGSGTKTTTVNHVVALFSDRYSGFLGTVVDKTTTKYVPEEDFTTFFHHVGKRANVDLRNSNIILTLA